MDASSLDSIVSHFTLHRPLLRRFVNDEGFAVSSVASLVLHVASVDDESGAIKRRISKD